MKISLFLLFSLLASTTICSAQELRKKAESNPLDCAYYLSTNNVFEESISIFLAQVYLNIGRYNDAIAVSKLEDNEHFRFTSLTGFGQRLIENNNKKEAAKFALEAREVFLSGSGDWHRDLVTPFVSLLVAAGLDEIAIDTINMSHNDDQGEKTRLMITAAEAYVRIGKHISAASLLRSVSMSIDSLKYASDLVRVTELYGKIGDRDKSVLIFAILEERANEIPNKDWQDDLLIEILEAFFKNGDEKKAMSVWQKVSNKKDPETILRFTQILIDHSKTEDAKFLLGGISQDEMGTPGIGRKVVKQLLMLGDVESAVKVAKAMSKENDDPDQQESLMSVSDHFIKAGNRRAAVEMLDFAFARARRIVYKDEPDTAGPFQLAYVRRKPGYLENIAKRFVKLGMFDRAIAVLMTPNEDYKKEKIFIASEIVNYGKVKVGELPGKEVIEIIDRAMSLLKDHDNHFRMIRVMAVAAEVFALLGEKEKAADILSELINSHIGESSAPHALIAAGEVFENYKLPDTPILRRSLVAILEHYDQ